MKKCSPMAKVGKGAKSTKPVQAKGPVQETRAAKVAMMLKKAK